MKRITKFAVEDGSEWDSEDDALDREELIRRVKIAAAPLGPPVDDIEFANGGGFVQHTPEILEGVRAALTEIQPFNRDINGPIAKPYWRLMNCDSSAREWGQGYFALNPSKGKQVEISRTEEATQ